MVFPLGPFVVSKDVHSISWEYHDVPRVYFFI